MKFKYFLRGLGTGIIFGALIMLVSYMTSGSYKITDEEIIRRAEKLGMVKEDNYIPLATDSDVDSDMENTADAADNTTDNIAAPTDEASTEDGSVYENDNKDNISDNDYVTAKITITGGMSSTDVAKLLEDAGIISDHLDFDSYLNTNGYSTQIRIKTVELNSNMSYEEIAEALTSGEDEK